MWHKKCIFYSCRHYEVCNLWHEIMSAVAIFDNNLTSQDLFKSPIIYLVIIIFQIILIAVMNDVVRNFRVKIFKMNYPAVIWSKINWINGCCKSLLPKAEGPIWDKAYFDPKKYISKPKSTFSNFYNYQLFCEDGSMCRNSNSILILSIKTWIKYPLK